MAITSLTQTRTGSITTMTAVSDLVPPAGGAVYLHWYLDGLYLGASTAPTWTLRLETDEQVRLDVLDTTDPAFDPIANAPSGYPARRWVWWVRSADASVAAYVVQQQRDGGGFVQIARVDRDGEAWDYAVSTPRLDDLTDYAWRVLAVDAAGNQGVVVEHGPERIVRTPDAPGFTATLDPVTTKMTFAAA